MGTTMVKAMAETTAMAMLFMVIMVDFSLAGNHAAMTEFVQAELMPWPMPVITRAASSMGKLEAFHAIRNPAATMPRPMDWVFLMSI